MLLPLKLLMTPILIALVSYVGRRWGSGVAGWLMGFPLTSGPVSIILTLQYGPIFAANAAVGTMGGQASVCIFDLVYCLIALVAGWPVCAGVAIGAFFLSVYFWNLVDLALLPTFILVVVTGLVVMRLIPRRQALASPVPSPRWDLPARMAAAAAFVLLLTTFADRLGPQLSGLLSPFPIFGVVIAAFTHHQQGPAAATQLLRGVVLGSFGFNTFFLVVAALLPHLSPGWVYLCATLAALAVNGFAFRFLKNGAALRESPKLLGE